ncbi:A24 family peptidase [Nocardia sp. NPDC019395]|uniref:A24 family peptidase n=1 Tax=Nocardia sp. NPDC019395 TaxID=3154686 RepID=UPI00340AFA54
MTTLGFLVLAGWCVVLSRCDIRSRRLPNPLTATGAAGVLLYAALTGHFCVAVRGAVLLAIPYLLVHLLWSAALGAGDVKLAVGLGAAAALGGGQSWMWSALAAPLFTAAAGIGLLLGRHTAPRLFRAAGPPGESPGPARARSPGGRSTAVAHGPSMCAATLLGLALW